MLDRVRIATLGGGSVTNRREGLHLHYCLSMSELLEPDEDGLDYSVRPEPPQFDEVIRRPALFSNESPFAPGRTTKVLGHRS
jgi:hypothetical protein